MKDDQGGRGRKDLVVERDDVIKNIIDSIRQHCNLPWPVKRAINVTINTAALKPQALFVVAMAAVKHPRFRLGNFILSFVSPHFTCFFLSPFSSLFFFLDFPFQIGYIPLHLSKAVCHDARDPDLLNYTHTVGCWEETELVLST